MNVSTKLNELSKEELIATIIAISDEFDILSKKNSELKNRNEILQKKLLERVKEFGALKKLSEIIESSDTDFDEILKETVQSLPLAFQFPEQTSAKLLFDGKAYLSGNFSSSTNLLSSPIFVDTQERGRLEVFYSGSKTHELSEAFEKEEIILLELITERIGKVAKRLQSLEKEKELNHFNTALTKTIPFGIDIIDDTGKILYANEPMLTEFGPEIIGKNCWETYRIDKEKCDYCPLKFTLEIGQTVKCESAGIIGDRIFEITHCAFIYQGQKALLEIFQDITERKRTEQKLQAVVEDIALSEKKYQLITENISDGVLIIGADTKIRYVSKSYLKQLGYSQDEVEYENAEQIYASVHPDYRDELISKINTAIEFKLPELVYTYKISHKNGHYIWREDHAKFNYNEGNEHIATNIICRDITERKATEEQIRKNERRIKEIFENMQDAYFQADLHGNFIFINPAALRMFGYDSREELIGKPAFILYSNLNDRIFLMEELGKKGKINDKTIQGRKKDGTVFWLSMNIQFLYDESGNILGTEGVTRDISERVEMVNKLEESETHFRSIIENSHAAYFFIDINGYFLNVNKAWLDLYKYDNPEDITGKHFSQFQKAEEVDKAVVVINEILKENPAYMTGEFSRRCKDGSIGYHTFSARPVYQQKKKIGIEGFLIDTTNQKLSEDKLSIAHKEIESSENKFRSLFNSMQEGVYLHEMIYDENGNAVDYRIIEANPASEKYLSIKRSDVIGKRATDLFKSAKAPFIELYSKVVETGEPKAFEEYFEPMDKHFYISVFSPKKGEFATAFLDISEQKRNELEIIDAKERAEENEKRLKLSQEDLIRMEGLLQDIQAISKTGGWEYQVDTQRMYWTPELFHIHDLSYDPQIDHVKISSECYLPEDRAKILEAFKLCNEKGIEYDLVFPFLTPKGNKKWIRTKTKPIFEEGKVTKVIGTLIDISEQKQIEKELIQAKEKAEENQKKLIEAQKIAKLGNWELDMETGLFTFNDSFYKLFHTTVDEIGGYQMTIADYANRFVHPEDAQLVSDETKRAIESTDPNFSSYVEHRIFYQDGGIGYISVRFNILKNELGKTIKTYGVNQDISEKKKAEEEYIRAKEIAEENEEKFKNIIESTNDLIWTVDPVNFGLQTFNTALNNYFLEMRGIQIQVGDVPEKIVTAKAEDWKTFYRKALELGKYEIEYETIAGSSILSLSFFILVRNNQIFGISVFGKDITKQKQNEIDLLKAKEKAIESDRLKSAFLLNISHEIRTPMNGILGFLGLLEEPDLAEEQRSEFIKIVNKSGERLMNTINDIVEISKIEVGDIKVVEEEVNLEEVMQFHHDFFKPQTKEKGLEYTIKQQLSGEEAIVKTDKFKLDGIIMNLIRNAIKFTNAGKIEIGNYVENDLLYFYVTDTGRGIPLEKQDVIFDRFIQAELGITRGHEGSGIGLSIVKSYLEVLHGTIQVKSAIGKGSTFLFSIPYKPIANLTNPNRDVLNPEMADKSKTILIAEDEEVNYLYLKNILSRQFQILHAQNGEEAVELFKNNPGITLVLMDIKMPGNFDGLQATRLIREINSEVPIIAQTAFAMNNDLNKALEAGCNDYISKPFTKQNLLSLIHKYCTNKG